MWNSMKYMKWTAYRIGSPLPPSWQLASAVASGISNIASLPLSVLLLPNMLYWQIYIFQMYIFYIYIHLIICGYHYFYIFIYIICMYLTYCVYWFKLLYVGFFFFFEEIEKRTEENIYMQSFMHTYIFYISYALHLSCGSESRSRVCSSSSGGLPWACLAMNVC